MSIQVPEETLTEIKKALFQGQKIQAIKLYREATKTGLAEAKAAMDDLETKLRAASPDKFSAPPSGKGCLGLAVMICAVVCGVIWWVVGK